MQRESTIPLLVARVGSTACAVPVEHVVETMRPSVIERDRDDGDGDGDGDGGGDGDGDGGSDDHRDRASLDRGGDHGMHRGDRVPVLDAAALAGVDREEGQRWVVVRAGDRRAAMVVDAVMGVRWLAMASVLAMRPLFAGANLEGVPRELRVVLDAVRVLPPEDE